MKFLTNTSQFLFALLLCIPARNIQANTMVPRRMSVRRYKNVNPPQEKKNPLTKKGQDQNWIIPAIIASLVLVAGAGYVYTQVGEGENSDNLNGQDEEVIGGGGGDIKPQIKPQKKPVEQEEEKKKRQQPLQPIEKKDLRYEVGSSLSSREKVESLLDALVSDLKYQNVGQATSVPRNFFKFMINVYENNNLDRYLSGLQGDLAVQKKSEFQAFLKDIIDKILSDKEIFPTRISQENQLRTMYEEMQNCNAESYSHIQAIYLRLNGVKQADLKVQIRVMIDQIKDSILKMLIHQHASNLVIVRENENDEKNKSTAPFQEYHLKNSYILKFGDQLGISKSAAVSDRFAKVYNVKLKKLTESEFIENYKKELNDQIPALAASIASDINGKNTTSDGAVTPKALELFLRKSQISNKELGQVDQTLQTLGYYEVRIVQGETPIVTHKMKEPYSYVLLARLGLIKPKAFIDYFNDNKNKYPNIFDNTSAYEDQDKLPRPKCEFTDEVYTVSSS